MVRGSFVYGGIGLTQMSARSLLLPLSKQINRFHECYKLAYATCGANRHPDKEHEESAGRVKWPMERYRIGDGMPS